MSGAAQVVEKEEHSSTADEIARAKNKTLCQSVWWFLRKLVIILLEDPAIPLLGINPEDYPACSKYTRSTIFIAGLFIVARTWKEPRCPSMEE